MQHPISFTVIKRDGREEPVMFDKITERIQKLCIGLDENYVEPILVAQKVCSGVYKGVTTVELDKLAAEVSAHLTCEHPDYGKLAARIAVSNLHKSTDKEFSVVMKKLYEYINPKTGKCASLLSDKIYNIILNNQATLDNAINYDNDYNYEYFGFKTLERSYLLKIDNKIVERPQHMIMRVAVSIHENDIDRAIETYNLMSKGLFTHASPTLFNAGLPNAQLSSCFLLNITEDSITGIYDTLKRTALISKGAGGVGLAIHKIRANGSYIAGTNGTSNGIIPMLRVFNNTARYVDQGGGKRKGSFAIYLEPWHADVFEFLDLRKNHGKEEMRARDLFYALWIPDLFMERVGSNGVWSLMCPHECPGLDETYGDAFKQLYEKYEKEQKYRKQIPARKLWQSILESQIETGTPYMLYKDACNKKSNQQNLGTIACSNLCTEIVQYTSPDEVAVCNLASIALNRFVKDDKTYDYQKLYEVTRVITRNLNRIIDINHYPIPEAEYSNFKHRPIGIGVQGFADALILLRLPFESEGASRLNKNIFETIYFAALSESVNLAKQYGFYESYPGSPASQGILQFDMWGVTPDSGLWNWESLKEDIKQHGLRNSLLVSPMPTASTSQILGNNECFEPYSSNMYVRRTLAGEFQVVNPHLLKDLIEEKLWDNDLKQHLLANNGSIQNIDGIPEYLKELYKTVWEIKGKVLVDLAADRGAYIDQSQSFNVHMENVNFAKLTSLHFYTWKKGLKTGMYYLRTKAAVDAIKFTVNVDIINKTKKQEEEEILCSLDNPEACTMCSA